MNGPGGEATFGARPALIYVARHAQPELRDGEHRFLGQSDAPLGTLGRRQARGLADRLSSVGFDALYSSDLGRCLTTARIVAARIGLSVRVDARLREIDTGLWDGLSPEQAARLYPAEHALREADLLGYPFPQGESFRDLERRVLSALDDILGRGDRRLLIIGHLGVNRVLLTHLLGRPLRDLFSIRQHYCSFHIVTKSDAHPIPRA